MGNWTSFPIKIFTRLKNQVCHIEIAKNHQKTYFFNIFIFKTAVTSQGLDIGQWSIWRLLCKIVWRIDSHYRFSKILTFRPLFKKTVLVNDFCIFLGETYHPAFFVSLFVTF
uniref:(northern house mosquito) hypothetical protein n=1 Tax=Culex pipiens TaxID=7175 RepID=A0A8D8JPU9_CULPI